MGYVVWLYETIWVPLHNIVVLTGVVNFFL